MCKRLRDAKRSKREVNKTCVRQVLTWLGFYFLKKVCVLLRSYPQTLKNIFQKTLFLAKKGPILKLGSILSKI